MQEQIIEFHRLRSFSLKMNATFEFIRQNAKGLLRALVFIAGPPTLLASLLLGSFFDDFLGVSMGAATDPLQMKDFVSSLNFWLRIVLIGISVLISSLVTMSVTYNYMRLYQERKSLVISTDDVWQRVMSTLGRYTSTITLYLVLIVLVFGILFIPLFGVAGGSAGIFVFSFLLFYIAVFYVTVTFSLLFVIRAWEPIGFFAAVTRSFRLVQGKWWSTFGILFVTSLIQSTVSSLFFIPWYVNFLATLLHSTSGNPTEDPGLLSQIISQTFLVLYFLFNVLLYCIPLIALAFQYFNLVELKESKGLMASIDTMGRQPGPADNDETY
jgi:hypothetical protein